MTVIIVQMPRRCHARALAYIEQVGAKKLPLTNMRPYLVPDSLRVSQLTLANILYLAIIKVIRHMSLPKNLC